MTEFETITLERIGKVAILTINRPEKLNALNSTVHREGVAILDELRTDDSVRVVIITGSGEKAFIAGADISEFEGKTPVTQRANIVVSGSYHVVDMGFRMEGRHIRFYGLPSGSCTSLKSFH